MISLIDIATPRLEINLNKIFYNAEYIVKESSKSGIQIVGITKGCAGNPTIAKLMIAAGVSAIGDSHVDNILKINQENIAIPFWVIRNPISGEWHQIVKNTFLSLNSELSTINTLTEISKSTASNHKIVVMIELGDKREGILLDELLQFLSGLSAESRGRVIGIGGTLGCHNQEYPKESQINILMAAADKAMKFLGFPLEIITIGGSSLLPLLLGKQFSLKGVTHLRIGEAILLGTDGIRENINSLYQDTLQLVGEVIEVHPFSKIDGNRDIKELIVGLGYQDIDIYGMSVTHPENINILSATSDHLILTCPDHTEIGVGKEIRFKLTYKSMLRAFVSPYVHKVFV